MSRSLSISIDLDGIVVDLYSTWLRLYNDDYGHGATIEDLVRWEMHECVKIGHDIYKYLDRPDLYVHLEPLPGAIEAVRKLQEDGHDVHIISSPAKHTQTASDKLTWCQHHLPFLKRQQITLSHQKHRFMTDVFIDDSLPNQKKHLAHQPTALRLAIAYPHNAEGAAIMTRVESFRDTATAWKTIVELIEQKAL